MESRSGIGVLLGAPNAGKSTLFNRLVGMPLASVTPKPQTTRFPISGLLTYERGQVLLIDTPGHVTFPKNTWHHALNRQFLHAAQKADVLVYLLSLRETHSPTPAEPMSFPEGVPVPDKPLLIGITHADEVPRSSRQRRIEAISGIVAPLSPKGIYDVSVDKSLEVFIQGLIEALPKGPPLYPEGEVTPQPLRFFVAELIRKQLYLHLHEELPYGIEVEITHYTETPERDYICATLYVEKPSHKPMVIGKGGTMIKKIGIEARKEIEVLVGKPIYLELYVKLALHWRYSIQMLRSWGYDVPRKVS